jgi:hypothetical protein
MSYTTQGVGRSKQSQILVAFASRLKQFAPFNDQNVVISDQPIPLYFPGGEMCLSVSIGAGHFPAEHWDAVHHGRAVEEGSLSIGIFKRAMLDRPGRSEAALVNEVGGLIADYKERVLSILCVDQAASGPGSPPWWPADSNGKRLTQQPPRPTNASTPAPVQSQAGWIGMQIDFAIDWVWWLYA